MMWPRFFRKTSIPKLIGTPVGPASIADQFGWAKTFMQKMRTLVGTDQFQKRLSSWKWQLDTAFTGVGCAESVATSDQS